MIHLPHPTSSDPYKAACGLEGTWPQLKIQPIEEHIGDSRTCKDCLQILYERAREGLTANEYVRSQLTRDRELALAYLGNTTRGRELLAAALSGAVAAIGNRHPRASQIAARLAVDTALETLYLVLPQESELDYLSSLNPDEE